MNSLFFRTKWLLQRACLASFFSSIFLSYPAYAQRHPASKNKVTRLSNKRVIYGLASFYGNKFNGRQTASGEIFSQRKLTCACNMLPFGTWIKVTNVHNNKSVTVKVNDRLHTRMRRLADLRELRQKK